MEQVFKACHFSLPQVPRHNVTLDLLTGLRISRVHVLFELPKHYPLHRIKHPLVYVEWFTPFRKPDPITGFYHLSKSTRHGRPYAEIITADWLVHNCLLNARKQGDTTHFFVNHYVDEYLFCTLKLGYKGCLPC